MMKFAVAVTLALVPLSASLATERPITPKQQAGLDRILAGRVAGRPASCIQRQVNQRVSAFGDGTLVFGDYDRLIWRNDPPGGCNGAGREGIIVTRSTVGSICRGDIVDIVDRTSRFPVGTCALGDFIPYAKASPDTVRP